MNDLLVYKIPLDCIVQCIFSRSPPQTHLGCLGQRGSRKDGERWGNWVFLWTNTNSPAGNNNFLVAGGTAIAGIQEYRYRTGLGGSYFAKKS